MNGKIMLTAMTIALASAASALQSITPSVPDAQWTKDWWLPRFDAKRVQAASGGCGVAFLGDSITHLWEDAGKNVWAANFAEGPYKAVNFGFSGDRTEHLLSLMGTIVNGQSRAILATAFLFGSVHWSLSAFEHGSNASNLAGHRQDHFGDNFTNDSLGQRGCNPHGF